MGGGIKAVWNFSENSSVLVWPPVPKMILNVNVSIKIDIFDNTILATLIIRKNIDGRWQNKIPMRLSLRSISCENTIQLRNTKEFFAPIRYNALSYILKQIIYMDVFTKKTYVAKSGREAEGRIQGFLRDDVPYQLKTSKRQRVHFFINIFHPN